MSAEQTTRVATLITAAACLMLTALAHSADESTEFARIHYDEQRKPQSLQMSVVSYGPENDSSGIRVDLVSAIHIGDPEYYAELNRRFRDYDALLYELVTSGEQYVPDPEAERRGFISGSQLAIKDALGLAFQLDEIDYGPRNFVHADLTSDELAASMKERNESLYVYFWRLFYASMDEYAKDPLGLNSWEILASLWADDGQQSLKVTFAKEMVRINFSGDMLEGDDGSAIIDSRNERAIEVLQQQLQSGIRRIGIFYGVAHMPDMEERLVNELGLVRKAVTWVDAWDLTQ